MAIISPHSPEDRRKHVLDGMIYDLEGNIFPEPSNYYANYRLADVDGDNDPDGMTIGMPEDPSGFYVYLSEKDKGPETCEAQNTEPISIEEPHYVVNEPRVDGHKPTTALNAAPIAPPPPPEITIMDSDGAGFAPGHYWLTYTWMDMWGKQTTPAPAIRTETPLAQGQHMLVAVPSPPEGAVICCFYLSRPNDGIFSIRFQEQINVYFVRPNEWTLKGPWKSGGRPPLVNQTVRPENKKPDMNLIKAYLKSDALARQGLAKARITTVDEDGRESAPSEWSDPVVMSAEDAEAGMAFKVDFEEDSKEDPNLRYNVYLDFEGNTEFLFSTGDNKSAHRPVSAPKSKSSARSPSGSSIVSPVQSANTGNVQNARSQVITGSSRTSGSTSRQPIVTRGVASNAALSGETGLLTQQEAPEVQTVEVEPPTTPLDPPIPVGATTIESPGDYWVRLSFYSRGRETIPSAAVKVELDVGETFRVRVPDGVNEVPNSQVPTVGNDHYPFDWLLARLRGLGFGEGLFDIIDGILRMDTLGAKLAAAAPYSAFKFNVDRARDYVVGATLSAQITAGKLRVVLTELDGDDNPVGSPTVIKELLSSGEVQANQTFGPSGQAWNGSTAKAQVTFDMPATTSNMVASIKNAYVHKDLPHAVRRREIFPKGFKLPSNASPSALIRWLKTSTKGVELPPVVARRPPEQALVDSVDFGEGSANFPANWTKAGTSASPTTNAAITGTHGFNLIKTTSGTLSQYIWRDVDPLGRTQVGLRASVRVKNLPTQVTVTSTGTTSTTASGYWFDPRKRTTTSTTTSTVDAYVSLLSIRDGNATGATDALAFILIGSDGDLRYVARNPDTGNETWRELAGGIVEGDVLDLELIATGGATDSGNVFAAAGKNGSTRQFNANAIIADWSGSGGRNPRTVQVGPSHSSQPGSEWEFDVDDLIITNSGDLLGDSGDSPTLEPLPPPDRPRVPTVTEYTTEFATGVIPSAFAQTRTPSDSTTTLAVGTPYAISGTYGLRVQDTGTATTSNVYLSQSFGALRSTRGFRTRTRIVARPSTSSVVLMQAFDEFANTLAEAYIDSTGDIYVRTQNASGTWSNPSQVADGVTNGTIVTLELVLTGCAQESGLLSAWIQLGGGGTPDERQLLSQVPTNWNGRGRSAGWRFGGMNEGSASTTYTFDYDDVVVTQGGEISFVEVTEDDLPVYQAYAHYLAEQPPRDDLWLRGLGFAVIPGETYTFGIWHRHAGVKQASFPYTWKAYDRDGQSYSLGSAADTIGGCIGTLDWTDLSVTFTVPSAENDQADCYEVWMTSPGVGGGEYVAQLPAFSRGDTAVRTRQFVEESTAFMTVDTDVPYKAPWDHAETPWLDFGMPLDIRATHTAEVLYASSDDSTPDPGFTPWQEEKVLVEQKRFLHLQVTLTCPSNTPRPPIVQSGSPYVENAQFLGGYQLPVLLREDLTEFPGGAVVEGDPVYTEFSQFDVYFPRGRAVRHRRYPPIGEISAFSIRAKTREAAFELTKNCQAKNMILELDHRRYKIKLLEPLTFATESKAPRPTASGVWYAEGVADVTGAEVIQHGPITGLPQAGFSAVTR